MDEGDANTRGTAPVAGQDGAGDRPGHWIGPYRLLERIGEGGFGVVWLAERREPMVQRVAIKILKPGMDSREVLARFEQERQALAVMNHPNVARVLDAGTTQRGLPFFVMEHVPGEPITAYCDRQRLTIKDRLTLFIPVCEAVQHAHHKGIIHRDLKPSNILVAVHESRIVPKVIDFGVAKAVSHTLTEKTIFTERGQLIGTPEYMSPEQAEMGATDIDTRTDVYSLGVVLYELLAGVLPFDPGTLRSTGYAEIQRIIREVDPPKPSTRLSALQTDAAQGSGGAQGNEPEASAPGRGAPASTAAEGSTSVAEVHAIPEALRASSAHAIALSRRTVISDLTRQLRRELDWIPLKAIRKERAERYASPADLARDIQRYLEGEPLEAGPESAAYRLRKLVKRNKGPVAAAVLVVLALTVGLAATLWQAAEARAQARRADSAARAETARADELRQVSEFQAGMLAQIDATDAGIRLLADIRERLDRDLEKSGVPAQERQARVRALGSELARVNATDLASAMIDRTILSPALRAIDSRFAGQPLLDASLRQTLADIYEKLGRYDQAMPAQERALATRRRALGENSPPTLASLSGMGTLLQVQGRLEQAEQHLRQAVEAARRQIGPDHADTLSYLNNLGSILHAQGKFSEAETCLRESLEGRRRVLGPDDPSTLATIGNLGFLYLEQARYDLAAQFQREALERTRRVLGDDHPDTLRAFNNMAGVLYSEGKLDQAEPYMREVLDKCRRLLGEEHPHTLGAINNLGTLLQDQGKLADAERFFGDALGRYRRVLGDDHPSTLVASANLAAVIGAQGRRAEAEPALRDVLERRSRILGAEHPDTLYSGAALAGLLYGLGRVEEAEQQFRDVLDKDRRVLGEDNPDTLEVTAALGTLLAEQGQRSQAEALLLPAAAIAESALPPGHPTRAALIEAVAALYAAWDKAEPGRGHDATAAQWKSKLDGIK